MTEQLQVQCMRIRYGSLLKEEFRIKNRDLIGQPIMGYNFGNCNVFTFEEYADPLTQKKLLRIAPTQPKDANSVYDLAELFSLEAITEDTVLEVAIMPLCFSITNTMATFTVGQEVVKALNIEKYHARGSRELPMGTRFSSVMYIEFGKVHKIMPSGVIKVELDAIPGQIEVCTNPVLLGPKMEVIPLLM